MHTTICTGMHLRNALVSVADSTTDASICVVTKTAKLLCGVSWQRFTFAAFNDCLLLL